MRAYEVIKKKRDGYVLTEEEMKFIVEGYVKGEIPDYQAAAFLMAVFFKGMTDEELYIFNEIMVDSGERVDLSEIEGFKVDKHSTGGVADTTTLLLAPMVAACGAPVAKMTGRGLGHTGGTIDKLESIPNFTCEISKEEFIKAVNEIGIAVVGQTASLAPADKKFYALRDVTATVDSIPLIAASIMSKKIASGSSGIVLDVKTGNGAFMTKIEDAISLAEKMVAIGRKSGRKMAALVTDMNEPLGNAVGNALEIVETVTALKGEACSVRLMEVVLALGTEMLKMAKITESDDEAREMLKNTISSGKALLKFKQMIKYQRGNPEVVDDLSILPKAKIIRPVCSKASGYIKEVKTTQLGMIANALGAGRLKKEDTIDPAVGFMVKKHRGDYVEKGEPIVELHANSEEKAAIAEEEILKCYVLSDEKPEICSPIYHTIKTQ